MIFVNLNVKKMDMTIWKIIYCKFDLLIKGILNFMCKLNIIFTYKK